MLKKRTFLNQVDVASVACTVVMLPGIASPRTTANVAKGDTTPASGTLTLHLSATTCYCHYNPSAHQLTAEMHVLLDCGCQKSYYITEQPQRPLNLDPEGEQHLAIATFE